MKGHFLVKWPICALNIIIFGDTFWTVYAAQSRTKCVPFHLFSRPFAKKNIVCWNKNYNEQFSGGEGMTPWGMKLGRDGQFIP